jgi:hypothetical protein
MILTDKKIVIMMVNAIIHVHWNLLDKTVPMVVKSLKKDIYHN